MEKIFKHPDTELTFIVTDPNQLSLMERYGYEEVKEVKGKKAK